MAAKDGGDHSGAGGHGEIFDLMREPAWRKEIWGNTDPGRTKLAELLDGCGQVWACPRQTGMGNPRAPLGLEQASRLFDIGHARRVVRPGSNQDNGIPVPRVSCPEARGHGSCQEAVRAERSGAVDRRPGALGASRNVDADVVAGRQEQGHHD
jgi:hypothetical protein